MELTVLAVLDCPNEPVLRDRLAEVLAEFPDVRVMHRLVQDEADAAQLGMRGSPTLLVNGVDPFATPGAPVSVSCRIYRDEAGRADGAPSIAALRQALARAGGLPAPAVPPVPVGRGAGPSGAGRGWATGGAALCPKFPGGM
jgi:hypothetical protein